jgi:hypothetical protein
VCCSMSCNCGCESLLHPQTVGEVVGVSSSRSQVYVAPIGECGKEPVVGDHLRLWEQLRSRRESKGDVFFTLLGGGWTWSGPRAKRGSGVVLSARCVPSVIRVGREGDAVLFLLWKPDPRRSILKLSRRCGSVKIAMNFVRLSGGHQWMSQNRDPRHIRFG